MIPDTIRSYLDSEGITYRLRRHPPRYTAQEVAAAQHVTGYRVAKVVVLRRGGEYSLAVLPAPELVDLDRLGRAIGGHLELVSEDEFARLFPDCEVGAMPPLGRLYGLPVFVDRHLTEQDQILFNGGTHEDLVEMAYPDFARIARPTVIDYGRLQ